MGYNDNGVVFLQFMYQFLDLLGGDGIQGGSRLIHEHDRRRHGQGTGDAEPLLLPSGQAQGGIVEPVFYLFPESRLFQAGLHPVTQKTPVFHAVDPQAIGHIFKNRFGEGVGFLKDHAHMTT